MIFRRCVPLLIAIGLAGCSSERTGPGPASLVEFVPSAKVVVRWKQNVGAAAQSVLRPAVTREGVYAANGAGKLSRFDRDSGKRSWHIETGFAIYGGVGAGEGLVLVGGEKGELAAYEEETGTLRWQVKVSSEVLSAPQVADGVVVVRTGDGRITALNAKDGSRLWLYERATPTLVVRNYAGVTIQGAQVYAGFAAGKLAAISLDKGNIIWETSISQPRGNTELERISDITSPPVVQDGQICAVAFQGRIGCLDAGQGSTQWSRELSSDKGMAVSRSTLFVTEANGTVVALDKSSGSSLWKNEQLLRRVTSAPFVLDDYAIVGDLEGYLHVLKREDGALVERFRTDGSAILIAPTLLGAGMLVQTTGGMLYSLAIQ